jgi:hypothetical protein
MLKSVKLWCCGTLLLALSPAAARADDAHPYGHRDTVMFVAAEVLIVADCLQSRDLANGRYVEGNPLIAAVAGDHPSHGAIITAGLIGGGSLAAAYLLLPPKVRFIAPVLVFGVELAVVTRNASLGMGMHF